MGLLVREDLSTVSDPQALAKPVTVRYVKYPKRQKQR